MICHIWGFNILRKSFSQMLTAVKKTLFYGQGAEYEVEDSEAWTPLHCAAKGG